MLDDLDKTNLVIFVYLIIFLIGFFGVRFFIKKKIIFGAIFWISSILNLFFYLYLMGNYRFYPKFVYPIINEYWPLVNIALFLYLIFIYFKQKYIKVNI